MAEQPASTATDPLHAHLVAAPARRVASRTGADRALLDARLAALQAQARPAAPAPARSPAAPGPLADLLQALRPPATPKGPRAGQAAEPELLQFFRSTWARLHAEQRLKHALADAPENPGPLNSEHLVHQALQLMRGCAPDYLRHFMAQVDALAWLEDLQAEAASAGKPAPKAGKTPAKKVARKTARARRT
ncbi:hypothetical protein GCM10007320_62000 [Pseudorhodoferax aquiterrae]|uniref:DUF2894 domain-containing protein n=1 Tax=Pseudorhodoferax aquiterrae TaxID=747304 RepID=A0ABQ3GDI3_9BURK|nr:DUF2894 domain-containing protein [Pseudorhodoferax aquiterrae]GHD02613.1 hypothetical protein GCM10007320_62000 [Pseudorhodoferax aquiterrae]